MIAMDKPNKAKKLKRTVFFAAFIVAFLIFSIQDYSRKSQLVDEGVRAKVRVGTDALSSHLQYFFKTTDSTSIYISTRSKEQFSLDDNHREVMYDKNEPTSYIFLPVKPWLIIWSSLILGLICALCFQFVFWYMRIVVLYLKSVLAINQE